MKRIYFLVISLISFLSYAIDQNECDAVLKDIKLNPQRMEQLVDDIINYNYDSQAPLALISTFKSEELECIISKIEQLFPMILMERYNKGLVQDTHKETDKFRNYIYQLKHHFD